MNTKSFTSTFLLLLVMSATCIAQKNYTAIGVYKAVNLSITNGSGAFGNSYGIRFTKGISDKSGLTTGVNLTEFNLNKSLFIDCINADLCPRQYISHYKTIEIPILLTLNSPLNTNEKWKGFLHAGYAPCYVIATKGETFYHDRTEIMKYKLSQNKPFHALQFGFEVRRMLCERFEISILPLFKITYIDGKRFGPAPFDYGMITNIEVGLNFKQLL